MQDKDKDKQCAGCDKAASGHKATDEKGKEKKETKAHGQHASPYGYPPGYFPPPMYPGMGPGPSPWDSPYAYPPHPGFYGGYPPHGPHGGSPFDMPFHPMYSGLTHPPIFHGEPLPDPVSPRGGSKRPEKTTAEAPKTTPDNSEVKPEAGKDAKKTVSRKSSTDSTEINPRAYDAHAPPPLGHHRFASPHSMMFTHPPAFGHPMYFQGYNTMSPYMHSPYHEIPPMGCPCCGKASTEAKDSKESKESHAKPAGHAKHPHGHPGAYPGGYPGPYGPWGVSPPPGPYGYGFPGQGTFNPYIFGQVPIPPVKEVEKKLEEADETPAGAKKKDEPKSGDKK